jgi:hypothetical protein
MERAEMVSERPLVLEAQQSLLDVGRRVARPRLPELRVGADPAPDREPCAGQ